MHVHRRCCSSSLQHNPGARDVFTTRHRPTPHVTSRSPSSGACGKALGAKHSRQLVWAPRAECAAVTGDNPPQAAPPLSCSAPSATRCPPHRQHVTDSRSAACVRLGGQQWSPVQHKERGLASAALDVDALTVALRGTGALTHTANLRPGQVVSGSGFWSSTSDRGSVRPPPHPRSSEPSSGDIQLFNPPCPDVGSDYYRHSSDIKGEMECA